MMRNSYLQIWGRVGLMLAAGAVVYAQESGQVSGVIKNQAGQPLSGVTVLLRAPQLLKPRTLVTGADGSYRFPLLPVGDYSLTATLRDHISSAATFRVGIGTRLIQDMVLRPIQTASATVEVVAATASAVDKADTKTATNFSAASLESLPAVDRAFYGAAQLAPGVVTTVTGSVSIRGGRTATTTYTVNGGSVGDEYQGQQYENRVVDDAIEDVQVIQSPLNARFGRTSSGIMNVVSKSGGNTFKGSIRKRIGRADWHSWRTVERENEAYTNAYSDRSTDVYIEGPILKDRLWFSAFTILQPPVSSSNTILAGQNSSRWTTILGAGGLQSNFGIPEQPFPWDLGRTLNSTDKSDTYQGKLTFAITSDHTVSVERYEKEQTITNANPYGVPVPSTIGNNVYSQVNKSNTTGFQYKGTFGSNIFLEAQYNRLMSGANFPAPPYPHLRLNVRNAYANLQFPYGFNLSPARDGRDSKNGAINVKIFAEAGGTHEIDAGFDWYQFERGTVSQWGPTNSATYAGWATPASIANAHLPNTAGFGPVGTDPLGNAVGFFAINLSEAAAYEGGFSAPTGIAPVYRKNYGQDGTTINRDRAIYVNDQWTLNSHWTLMAGLRLDRSEVVDTTGVKIIEKTAPISPRFSLKYDIEGNSRRVIAFSVAKYIDHINASFTNAFITMANSKSANFGWSAFDVGDFGFVGYDELMDPTNYGGPRGSGSVAGAPYAVADSATANRGIKDITNPYSIEWTIGYKRSYTNGAYLSVNLVRKTFYNDWAITRDFEASYAFRASDPSGISTLGVPSMAVLYHNSDLLKRLYQAVEMEFGGKSGKYWNFSGSYTYGRLTGNQEGGDQTGQGFRANVFSAPTYLRNWLLTPPSSFIGGAFQERDIAPEGPLSSDRTHKLRLTTTLQLPLGKGWISYALMARYDSGAPYNTIANNSTQSALFRNTLPTDLRPTLAGTFARFYASRGSFRYHDTYACDFKVAFEVPVFWRVKLMGDILIRNCFNTGLLSTFNTNFSSGTVAPANRWLPITTEDPVAFGTDDGDYTNYMRARTVSASMGLRF